MSESTLTQVDRRNCEVEGCDKPTRSGAAVLCAMHYHRVYRHGSVDKAASSSGVSVKMPRAYTSKRAPNHPLARKNGRVYTHRMVLFDAIGYGPHACHWCSAPIDWKRKGEGGELYPDHLNGRGDDNRIENLVPSCRGCNSGRAMQARAKELRSLGWWSNNDTLLHLKHNRRRDPIEAEPHGLVNV